MDSRLDKIHAEVVDIKIMVAKNTITLEQNTKDMAEHIKRTSILEDQMKTALIPITLSKWVAVLLGVGASVAAIIYTIIDIVKLTSGK